MTTETLKESLSDKAYDLLEELIVSLEIAPGSVLSEIALSKRLKIGRTPLREALKRLASEKLVYSLPRRGLVVSDINITQYLALLETRRVIDRLIVSRASRRATPDQRATLRQLASEMSDAAAAHDLRRFIHIDHECDMLLAKACRNSFAAEINSMLLSHCRRFWFRYQHDDDVRQSALLHTHMLNAVSEGREDDAAAASDTLMDYLESFARKAMDHF